MGKDTIVDRDEIPRGLQKHKKSYRVENIFKACLRRPTDRRGHNILGVEAESSNFTIYDYTATGNLPVPGPEVIGHLHRTCHSQPQSCRWLTHAYCESYMIREKLFHTEQCIHSAQNGFIVPCRRVDKKILRAPEADRPTNPMHRLAGPQPPCEIRVCVRFAGCHSWR